MWEELKELAAFFGGILAALVLFLLFLKALELMMRWLG